MPYYKLKNDDLNDDLEYTLQWNNLVSEPDVDPLDLNPGDIPITPIDPEID